MLTEPSMQSINKNFVVVDIPLIELSSDPCNPRKYFDEADREALTKSIQTDGLINPIVVRLDSNGNKIIVNGERRFRAFKALGLETIPAKVIDTINHEEIALIDNIVRVDLHTVEMAEALKSIMKYGYTQEKLGDLIGKASNTVCEILKLMDLTQGIRDDARVRKELSRSKLLPIARLKKARAQEKAYDALIAKLSRAGEKRTRTRHPATKKVIAATETTLKYLNDIDLESLGQDKEEVVAKLQDLLVTIRNKFGILGG